MSGSQGVRLTGHYEMFNNWTECESRQVAQTSQDDDYLFIHYWRETDVIGTPLLSVLLLTDKPIPWETGDLY